MLQFLIGNLEPLVPDEIPDESDISQAQVGDPGRAFRRQFNVERAILRLRFRRQRFAAEAQLPELGGADFQPILLDQPLDSRHPAQIKLGDLGGAFKRQLGLERRLVEFGARTKRHALLPERVELVRPNRELPGCDEGSDSVHAREIELSDRFHPLQGQLISQRGSSLPALAHQIHAPPGKRHQLGRRHLELLRGNQIPDPFHRVKVKVFNDFRVHPVQLSLERRPAVILLAEHGFALLSKLEKNIRTRRGVELVARDQLPDSLHPGQIEFGDVFDVFSQQRAFKRHLAEFLDPHEIPPACRELGSVAGRQRQRSVRDAIPQPFGARQIEAANVLHAFPGQQERKVAFPGMASDHGVASPPAGLLGQIRHEK